MKKTRLFLLSLLCTLALPAFVACDDDDDFTYFVDMATVVKENDRWLLQGDDTGLLQPDNEGLLTLTDSKKEDQRVIASFNFDEKAQTGGNGAKPIFLYDVYRVLTKPVYHMPGEGQGLSPEDIEEKQDSIGHDRIRLLNAFTSSKHLNVRFCLYSDAYSDKPHFINLVAGKDAQPDANGVLTVELRHNLSGNQERVLVQSWAAFPLNSIPGYQEGTTKKLKIVTHDIDNETIEDEVNLDNINNKEPKISAPSSFSNTKMS